MAFLSRPLRQTQLPRKEAVKEKAMLHANTFGSLCAAFGGSASDAGTSMAGAAPGIIQAGMGSALTYGRRTADIISLNLAGKGGLPQALSSASSGAKSLLGSMSRALSLGLSASEKAAVDAGLFGAEAVGCAIPQ